MANLVWHNKDVLCISNLAENGTKWPSLHILHLQKQEFSGDILKALVDLKEEGGLQKWGSVKPPERINVFKGELKKVGVKNTGAIATPTIRNERAFLVTVVGVTSVLATAAGFLPGDWVCSCMWSKLYMTYCKELLYLSAWMKITQQQICSSSWVCLSRYFAPSASLAFLLQENSLPYSMHILI